jgi:hypothetical protein
MGSTRFQVAMSIDKKLLIVNPKQFGYHLDTYYYCKWASTDFQIPPASIPVSPGSL